MQPFDVIIVGGGLAGACLALALRDSRLRIALVEGEPPRQKEGWDERIYAISPANAQFLESIGVWRHLAPGRVVPIRSMQVSGDRGGRLEFSAFESGVSELGWILESSLLSGEFWETAKRQGNLSLHCPARCVSLDLDEDSVRLGLADGTVLSAALVVGADGRDSWVRRQTGLEAIDLPYGEKGVVANFECERPHRHIAFQWFRADGVLAYLPLPGNRISIVWSTPNGSADELCALSPEVFCERVAEAGGHALGQLSLLTCPQAFPLRLIRVPRVIAPRVALIGDAAHGIHPLTGHGINLGFQDARELACLLAVTQPWQDIGNIRLLGRYQRSRVEETVLLQSATDAMHRLFGYRNPGFSRLRNFGLTVTDRLPPVKNLLSRYAMGFV